MDARGLSLIFPFDGEMHLELPLAVVVSDDLGQGNSIGNLLKLILDIVGSYSTILNRSELC